LSIDEFTGDIFGTPTEPVNACHVTATAFNGSGECSTTVDITVTETVASESGGRNRDRDELAHTLQAAAALNNQKVVLQTAETKDELPEGWERKLDVASGKQYFLDHRAKQTHWQIPAQVLTNSNGSKVKPGDKYVQARLLEYGPAQASTLGIINFMGVDQASFHVRLSAGVDAMVREVKDRSQVEEQRAEIENYRRELEDLVAKGAPPSAVQSKQKEIDEKTKETDELEEMLVKAERVFLHILNEEAGTCNETFQNSWKMDCDPDTGEVLSESIYIYIYI
jgi:hypothetical protein